MADKKEVDLLQKVFEHVKALEDAQKADSAKLEIILQRLTVVDGFIGGQKVVVAEKKEGAPAHKPKGKKEGGMTVKEQKELCTKFVEQFIKDAKFKEKYFKNGDEEKWTKEEYTPGARKGANLEKYKAKIVFEKLMKDDEKKAELINVLGHPSNEKVEEKPNGNAQLEKDEGGKAPIKMA